MGVSSNVVVSAGTKNQAKVVASFAGTITKWRLVSDVNTNAVVDVWKNGVSVTAGDKPLLVGASLNSNSTLTGWTLSIAEGDVLMLEVESNSAAKMLQVQLVVE
jgi:hypothetical protein